MSGDELRFKLDDEVIADVGSTYQGYMDAVTTATKTFIEGVKPVATRTNFGPIVNIVNACIKYNNEVKECIKANFDAWVDGDSSLVQLAIKIKGGEELEGTASDLQDSLDEIINNMLEEEEELSLSTAQSEVVPSDFEKMEEVATTYSGALSDIYEEAEGDISGKAEENLVYNSIRGPVLSTLQVITSSYEKVATQLGETKDAYSGNASEIADSLSEAADTAISAAEQKGQEIFDSYTEELDY